MQDTWQLPGLHYTPRNGANPSASGSKWGSLCSPESAGRELGRRLVSHQLQQEHPSAAAAWAPPCCSGGARVGEVHHVGALFPRRFRSLHCSTWSRTGFVRTRRLRCREVHGEGSVAKPLNCLPGDGEITPAPPGPWFIISPVCSLINNSYVNRHIPNPLLPITLATAQQSRPFS